MLHAKGWILKLVPLFIHFIIFYDLYVLKGRGTVATGRIEQGIIKAGEDVEILGLMQVKFVILF